ncbi:LpqN/LpqT family lipoprotein [Cellulosimicrobium sp. CUA-896]|uniref:LpqN/LpqT family lipoprotein n=1 Tax=Cellulosimicrobium sp. CUA-896 TaxID=1517881 RepID=UPI00130174BB|nr:LpqN/LpqT family lipoprotein [Cellulosimicrobium sp. CUA-896]
MRRATTHRLLTVPATAAVLAVTAACGPADAPAPEGPVTYDVPGVPATLTAPAGWERSTQDGAFLVRSDEAGGSPAARANVVVTAETATQSLEEAGDDTVGYVEDLAGWQQDADGQGPTTLGEAPAYRVSGTFEDEGALVAQEILLVEAPADGATWVVQITASYARDDAEGAAQAREAVESVRVGPAG